MTQDRDKVLVDAFKGLDPHEQEALRVVFRIGRRRIPSPFANDDEAQACAREAMIKMKRALKT
jgi:hypothetical protein